MVDHIAGRITTAGSLSAKVIFRVHAAGRPEKARGTGTHETAAT